MAKRRGYLSLIFIMTPALLVFGCSDGIVSIGTVDIATGQEIVADTPALQAVKRFNADYFDSRIARWGNDIEAVEVYDSVGILSLQTIIDEVNEAQLGPKLVIGDSDSEVRIYQDYNIGCGDRTAVESWNYWSNHEIASVGIGINTKLWWCAEKLIVKHALIHSLGFWGHTDDWGVMRGLDTNDTDWLEKWTEKITEPVILTMRELYRIPPGTKIN